jgi:hypothetical protein
MFKGALTVAERVIWAMISIIALLILAFYILGKLQDAGDGNILGRFAEWINDHARPQAS